MLLLLLLLCFFPWNPLSLSPPNVSFRLPTRAFRQGRLCRHSPRLRPSPSWEISLFQDSELDALVRQRHIFHPSYTPSASAYILWCWRIRFPSSGRIERNSHPTCARPSTRCSSKLRVCLVCNFAVESSLCTWFDSFKTDYGTQLLSCCRATSAELNIEEFFFLNDFVHFSLVSTRQLLLSFVRCHRRPAAAAGLDGPVRRPRQTTWTAAVWIYSKARMRQT